MTSMNTVPHALPVLVGRALQSTVLIMGELGSIGAEVLKAHNVFEIEVDGWYPAKLRQEIHEAAYKRFGPEALLNFGFSMGDYYSQALITASLGKYQALMGEASTLTAGLDWFVQNFALAYHEATHTSQSCEGMHYGFYAKRLDDLRYEFNAVTTLLAHHQSFSEGIIRGYLVRFISHDWEYELSFHPQRTVSDSLHSAFFWTCEFKPQRTTQTSAEEFTAAYRLKLKEILFKKVLEESNTALATLMSSVRYARLIQQAQLPHVTSVRNKLQDFAVEWHPRDTIGGDFWWSSFHEPSDSLTIALVDCAGHGVPGAMLSVLVNSQLEKIFSAQPTVALSQALLQLDDSVRKSLRQHLADSESDDGCDGAIVRLHLKTRSIEFVGAKINLYEVDATGKVEQHKADRISLGYRDFPRGQPVTQQWKVSSGSRFILVTDGVTDQLGGPPTRPVAFGYKRMVEALALASSGNAQTMAAELLSAVTQWQGQQARRDDLTILALEMSSEG